MCCIEPELFGLKSSSEFLPLLYVGKNLLHRELCFSVTPPHSGNRWLPAFPAARQPPAPPNFVFGRVKALSISEV